VTIADVSDINLVDPAIYANGIPHDLFTELRAAGAVHRHRAEQILPGGPEVAFWSIVRHAEIQQANRDWETFTATHNVVIDPAPSAHAGSMLVSMDPPAHTRLRRLITAGFTPRMIGRLEAHIADRSRRILAAAAEKRDCDFVRDIAYELPMHVIADIVGIPEADRDHIFSCTDASLRGFVPGSGVSSADRNAASMELFRYAQELTELRRREPADDVWTLIARAELGDADGNVTRVEGVELETFFMILAIAGSETTRNALTQGLLALLEHPDQLDVLRAHPESMPTAADEIIRWASPVLFFARSATRRTELGEATIEAGDRVVLWYPSGNRDERAFDEPFRFDVRRDPNPHVSFGGGGPHYCLGANLARKEVEVMIGMLVERFDVEATGDPVWLNAGAAHNVGVSIDSLAVRLTERS
jgi:cytochrome P450